MRRGCRPAFSGTRPLAAPRPHLPLRQAVVVRASPTPGQWPDPDYINEVLAEFPDKGLASIEEARVLFGSGYVWLDVRSELERDEVGKVKGSVNVPFVNLSRVYDASQGKKVVKKTPNPNFLAQVQKKFPAKDTKLMVGCSNGKAYSIDALEQLEDAGYENLCFVRGGYNLWTRYWDNNLRRRRDGEYAEKYDGEGADSCGIHASGAGFDKVDKADKWSLPVY